MLKKSKTKKTKYFGIIQFYGEIGFYYMCTVLTILGKVEKRNCRGIQN